MLELEQIEKNKQEFINLLQSLKEDMAGEHFDIDGLITYLESSDFFYAPATTKYYYAYAGGLCAYSLAVYNNLKRLLETFADSEYNDATIKIIGLLHSLNKINYYEKYIANEKVYSNIGTKHDNLGYFDWVSKEKYKVKDSNDRQTYGSKDLDLYIIIKRYIPLLDTETLALTNQSFWFNEGKAIENNLNALSKEPLITYLHTAMMLTGYGSKE